MGRKSFLIILFTLFSIVGLAQFKVRPIQLGISPGISTNGIDGGEYFNNISINLLSSYSAGTLGLSASLFSNFNLHNSFGLQVSGITNIVGGNRFVGMTKSEIRKLKKEERMMFEADFKGLQITGIGNVITGNQYGVQIGGIFNKTGDCQSGIQIAGLWNFVHDHSEGLQVSGLMNLTKLSHRGVQFSPLFNYAGQGLHGIQVGLMNKCGILQGRKSKNSTPISGFQIGLINKSIDSGGTQVGLINIASKSRGTQIGLINISKDREKSDRSVGILNYGDAWATLRLISDPLFPTTFEVSHGTDYWQDVWILGYNPHLFTPNYPRWKIGHSYERTKLKQLCACCPVIEFTSWGFTIENFRYPDKSRNSNLTIMAKIQKGWLTKANPSNGIYFVIGAKAGPTYGQAIQGIPTQMFQYHNENINGTINFNFLPYIGILYM